MRMFPSAVRWTSALLLAAAAGCSPTDPGAAASSKPPPVSGAGAGAPGAAAGAAVATADAPSATAGAAAADAVRWTIAPSLADCVGVAPMKCMRYRDAPDGPWKNHYGRIEGFEYAPGFQYELLVRFERVANPPADAPGRRVILVRELERKQMGTESTAAAPAAAGLPGTRWQLVSMPGVPAPSSPGLSAASAVTLEFDGAGRASGRAAVNRYFGSFTADGTALKFGSTGVTRMAGPPDAMAAESEYLARLGRVARYETGAGRLRLMDASGTTLLEFQAAPAGARP